MRALTVAPGIANSARVEDVPEPPQSDGAVLVRTLALGVCGTDREIVSGDYGWAPPGAEAAGDRPRIAGQGAGGAGRTAALTPAISSSASCAGPIRCRVRACAVGEWDMCRNGRYTERGIKERNGYGSDFFRIEPEFLVKLDPSLGMNGVLVEPTSVVAKAWDHTERIGRRSRAWEPKTLLVTGAGPIGLLAALIGAQRGLDVHVLDHRDSGRKSELIVRELGGTFHLGSLADLDGLKPDILMECTGAPERRARRARPHRVRRHRLPGRRVRARPRFRSSTSARSIAPWCSTTTPVFGSVNANRKHYEDAVDALQRADKHWLARLITRRVPVEQWTQALDAAAGRH